MTTTTDTEIAIVGAGPIGIEAGLYALQQGHDVRIFERQTPGASLRRWSHVEFFSPWKMNRSDWGKAHLRRKGIDPAPDEEFPTGGEYLEKYLHPLSRTQPVTESLESGVEVLEISRQNSLKSEAIGSPARTDSPFVLRIDDGDDQRYARAETVLDTSGVLDTPNGLGPGGMRAIGEREHAERIEYDIPDIKGAERNEYRDEHTLVVGDGHSAITTLRHLHDLQQEAPEIELTWLLRNNGPPYTVIDDDPLPMRRELAQFGNAVVAGEIDGIHTAVGLIERIEEADDDRLAVLLRQGDEHNRRTVDRLVANVGYRPNLDLFRELQVHTCYATEGPMDLAASLLADGGKAADCLDQSTGGREQLTVPEPNFFVLGSKSYGRNSNFLLQIGFEQIEQVFGEKKQRLNRKGRKGTQR